MGSHKKAQVTTHYCANDCGKKSVRPVAKSSTLKITGVSIQVHNSLHMLFYVQVSSRVGLWNKVCILLFGMGGYGKYGKDLREIEDHQKCRGTIGVIYMDYIMSMYVYAKTENLLKN